MNNFPTDDVMENSYMLYEIREFDPLQTVLEFFEMEIHPEYVDA